MVISMVTTFIDCLYGIYDLSGVYMAYIWVIPSGNLLQLAIEKGPFSSLIYLLKMVIFHSYVSLPEGTLQ